MPEFEEDKTEEASQVRRAFLKSASGVATGVVLTGPILGVSSDEVAAAGRAVAQAAQSAITPFGYVYGGPFITALNKAFSYSRLYDAKGVVDRSPTSTIGIFLQNYPTPGSYDKSKFGEFAGKLLQKSDWFDTSGRPLDQDKYRTSDAPGIFDKLREKFCSSLDPNLRSDQPKPVFLFVGVSSYSQKDIDPLKQNGYRFISTTAIITDDTDHDREHIVMGILCPPEAGI